MGAKRIREGLLQKWPNANFSEVATDEVLVRLADSRNTASKSANTFMLVAAGVSLLYLLKVQGVASEIGVGPYSLENLPFGLFVLACAALVSSCVSLIRIGDSRAYDRQLMVACEQRFGCECQLRYLGFPNEFAWGEPFSQMVSVVQAGVIGTVLRIVTGFLMNLYLLGLVAVPMATRRYVEEESIGEEIMRDVSVAALNVNSKNGRAFLLDERRTIPYVVHKDAAPRTIPILSKYLQRYANRTGDTVNIRYRPVTHIDGRVKRLIVFDCFDLRDAA